MGTKGPQATATLDVQLTGLSSVLNGLETRAVAANEKINEVLLAVSSGNYRVDPIEVSRRIVGELLGRGRSLPGQHHCRRSFPKPNVK